MAPTLQYELDDAVVMICMIYLNCTIGEQIDAIDNAVNTHQVPGTRKRYQYSGTLINSKLSCIRQIRPL